MDNIWNNRAVFTGSKDSVWHKKGVYLGEEVITDSEVWMEKAGLDYDVYKEPLLYEADLTYVDNVFAIVRNRLPEDGEGDGVYVKFGIATGEYDILQNRDAFKFFDPLVKEGVLSYSAAGSLGRGEKVWIAAKLNEGVVRQNPDGSPDTVESYVLLFNGHDGKTSSSLNKSNIRSVCQNTIDMALAKGATVRRKHMGGTEVQLDSLRRKLEDINKEFRESMEFYRHLNATKIRQAHVETFLHAMYPPEIKVVDNIKTETRPTKMLNKIEEIKSLVESGTGNGGGTLWDLFNGMTEFIDHHSNIHKGTDRLESIWFGSKAQERQRALDVITEMSTGRLAVDTRAMVAV